MTAGPRTLQERTPGSRAPRPEANRAYGEEVVRVFAPELKGADACSCKTVRIGMVDTGIHDPPVYAEGHRERVPGHGSRMAATIWSVAPSAGIVCRRLRPDPERSLRELDEDDVDFLVCAWGYARSGEARVLRHPLLTCTPRKRPWYPASIGAAVVLRANVDLLAWAEANGAPLGGLSGLTATAAGLAARWVALGASATDAVRRSVAALDSFNDTVPRS